MKLKFVILQIIFHDVTVYAVVWGFLGSPSS
jgi:hypothetical protein